MSDILDLIDAATGCQQCEGPLGDSPSDSFCGEVCQERWQAERVGARRRNLLTPLPNLGPGVMGMRRSTGSTPTFRAQTLTFPDMRVSAGVALQLSVSLQLAGDAVRAFAAVLEPLNEAATKQDRMQAALEERRNRNTGPARRERAARRIDPRGNR